MYDQQKLINLEEKIQASLDDLLYYSELVDSEFLQKVIADFLKATIISIKALDATVKVIFLMNSDNLSLQELNGEYPEEDEFEN